MTAPAEPPSAPSSEPSAPRRPGYALPDAYYTVPAVRHTSRTRVFVILGVALAVVVAVITMVAWWLKPPPPLPVKCPPLCGGPPPRKPPIGPVPESQGQAPTAGHEEPPVGQVGAPPTASAPPGVGVAPGPPVYSLPRFSPSGGAFSVEYLPQGKQPFNTTVTPTIGSNGVALKWTEANGQLFGEATLFGEPAGNQTARDIVDGLIQKYYPGAELDYEITNAMVGYQPGYGVVENYYPQAGASSATSLRVLVMVAVKNGLALVATADGPRVAFHQATDQDSNGPGVTDHPSGTDLAVAQWVGGLFNSFSWKGDPVSLAH